MNHIDICITSDCLCQDNAWKEEFEKENVKLEHFSWNLLGHSYLRMTKRSWEALTYLNMNNIET